MTDGLAATLPLGALSGQDALCTQPIGVAQPAAQVACHVQEELIDTHNRGTHPDLEQIPRHCSSRLDRNRALSEHRVGRVRQRAISHGPVRIAHAAGMGDVRLGIGYIKYNHDAGSSGLLQYGRAGAHEKVEMR